MSEYEKRNPWVVQNLQNGAAKCGRFATREQAERHAVLEYGGVVSVSDSQRVVYVSQIPSL